jgi:hypothetical protein
MNAVTVGISHRSGEPARLCELRAARHQRVRAVQTLTLKWWGVPAQPMWMHRTRWWAQTSREGSAGGGSPPS